MAAKFNPPKEFDFDPASWPEWFGRWSRYRTISKLTEEDAQLQIDSFLYCMGSKSESILNGLGRSNDDMNDYKKVTDAFKNYFSPRKYIIYERSRFFRRDQQSGETVEQYVRALNDIADRCDFSNRSEQMRDRIVVGISDMSCSREMQKMDVNELTEEVAIRMARQSEQVDQNIKELSRSNQSYEKSVDIISKSQIKNNKQSVMKYKEDKHHICTSQDTKQCGRRG